MTFLRYLGFFIFLEQIFAFNPQILKLLNEALNDGALEFSQYQQVLEELKQNVSCQKASQILHSSIGNLYDFECDEKKIPTKTETSYQSQFFPEINLYRHQFLFSFKNKILSLKQKLNNNSINDISQVNLNYKNQFIQFGHLSIPRSNLVGRNYWVSQNPLSTKISSLGSPRKKFHGLYWKKKTKQIQFNLWYSYNTNLSSLSKNKITATFIGVRVIKKWKQINIGLHSTLQYFNQKKLNVYTVLNSIHFKELWLNQSISISTSPSSSFHSNQDVLPWFISWQWQDLRKTSFFEFSKANSNYWNPLHPYYSRSDSVFFSEITAYGANENRLHWRQKVVFWRKSRKNWIKISPILFNTKAQWVQREGIKLLYFSSADLSLKANNFKTNIKLKYQNTSSNPFSSIRIKQNWIHQRQQIHLKNELKSKSYQGSYPFPSSLKWLYKTNLFTFHTEILTHDMLNPLAKWNFELSHSWNLNSYLIVFNETLLSFEKTTLQNNLYYQIQVKGIW